MSDVHIDWNTGAINALLKSSSGEVGRDLARRGQNVVNTAKQLAPKDTHALANSIHMEGPNTENDELQVSIIADTDYAVYVELGTRFMTAQPFLAPALDQVLE